MGGAYLRPRKYFVVGGRGLSRVSKLNAFDRALHEAGISHCNIVPVSSILPRSAEEVESAPIEPGAIVFVIMARADGESRERISAGLAWARTDDYGLVAEGHAEGRGEELREELLKRIEDMAAARGLRVVDVKCRVEELVVPEGLYGSAVVALVLVP